MNITLNGPVTLTLSPEYVSATLDCLAKNLSYLQGRAILDECIIPQLQSQAKPPEEKNDGTSPV